MDARLHRRLVWGLAPAAFAVDQLPKLFAAGAARNSGLSLGFMTPPRFVTLAVSGTLLLIAAVVLAPRVRPAWAAAVVLGGAAANLADRCIRGAVVDFIPLGWIDLNPADVFVAVGVMAIAISTWPRIVITNASEGLS